MKVTVDIDCTPEEARRFLGLPDLSPVHELYVDQMKKAILQGVSPELLETMMRSWSPIGEAGMEMWRNMFTGMAGSGTK